MNPKVSILISVYNSEKFLEETLESVINQTWQNIEIIIVNDGSSDNSKAILDSYESKYPDIIKIYNQPNKGQCAALNKAYKQSTGEYLKFFDSDDIMNHEHISLQVERLKEKPGYLASSEWGRFYDGNPRSAIFNPEPVWRDMPPIEWIVCALSQKSDMMGAPLWLIPRNLLEKAGLWDERLSLNNDFDFSIRLILASKGILFTEGAKIYYRSGLTNSLATQKSEKAMKSAFLTTQLGCKSILQYEDSERTRRVCANRFKYWSFQFYPFHKKLYKQALEKVQILGGSKLKIDAGPRFQIFIKLFGWKIAKLIKLLTEVFKNKKAFRFLFS